jgi:uncharacterized protein YbbC (DUF1343 family)
MIRILISIFGIILSFGVLYAQPICGADQYWKYLPLLKGKRVAMMVNPTSMVTIKKDSTIHLVDFLIEKKIQVKIIFAPEHGFRGEAEAGAHVKDGIDTKSKVRVVSLYGNKKKPTKKDLEDIDIVLFDIQDVGVRFYTYLGSLHYLVEACSEFNKKLIILDRPNPNGHYIDGPVLDTTYRSFIGMHPVPVVHGMTVGEYAQMMIGEKWVNCSPQFKVQVITIKNYTHQTRYILPIAPSPNLPNEISILLYPSLCFFEGTQVSLGRGTSTPFQIAGAPWYPDTAFSFTPKPIKGKSDNPPFKNQKCYGIDYRTEAYKLLREKTLRLDPLLNFYQNKPDSLIFFTQFFTQLAGTDQLQKQIEKGWTEQQIRLTWVPDIDSYKVKRQKYLIYKE